MKSLRINYYIVVIFFAALAAISLFFIFKDEKGGAYQDLQEMTLKEASYESVPAVMKILVQKEDSIDSSGSRYEKGDVVLVAPESKEFSIAEKEGFIVLKVMLTSKQAELLTLPEEKEPENKSDGRFERETVKRRKFSVDFDHLKEFQEELSDVALDEEVFSWEILKRKS